MKKSYNELGFTENEFHFFCDSLNGCMLNTSPMNCQSSLRGNIYDSIDLDDIHLKWNVESDLLFKKLDKLDYMETLMLASAVDDFWQKDDEDFPFPYPHLRPLVMLQKLINKEVIE